MSGTQGIFEQYRGSPVTSQCYKELGQKIQQYSQPEREALFEGFHPNELHLQLLKLTAARTSGFHLPLLDGLKEESKILSKFSLKSRLLFNGSNTELLDTNVLIPLLQTVSASTRNRILWNLGKHVSAGFNSKVREADVDTIYNAVSKVWGSNVALPLLCQTSKELLERELSSVTNLSNGQLLVIGNKFPFLALAFLEQNIHTRAFRKSARHIVRKTIPKSFDYILKQDASFLTKSMMKIILKNHCNVVLESPASWINVLDKHIVKKVLRPEDFQLFLTKQMLSLTTVYVPHTLLSYFEMLSPNEVSSILSEVVSEKYSCSLRSRLDFWANNVSLLKLLEASDRSFIAGELNTKGPLSTRWLPLMATDISMPRIRKLLSIEQDARARSRLVSQLIETVLFNKDQSGVEDICNLVVTRYRNDKPTLQCFFNSDLNFSSLSTGTFDLVLATANRFYNPDDWMTDGAAKLFPVAIKRNWGVSGLKEFLQHFLKGTRYFTVAALADLENELRVICIEEVFTSANIENKYALRQLAQFLYLIPLWAQTSSFPLITDNVKNCILFLLKSDIDSQVAANFVCANLNSLNIEFIEDCFQFILNPKILAYLVSNKSHIVSSKETLKRIGKHIVKVGVRGYVTFLKNLMKLGYTDMLQYLSTESKEALAETDPDKWRNCTNAVVLLVLSSSADDFFSTIDPCLPSTENNKVDTPKAGGDGGNQGRYCPLRASKREDAIYYGFGMSISHLEIPALAVERMRRFCVSGDLVLFVRDALYSVSCCLPNDKAKMFLLSLMKQPVSVKKHALRLLWRDVCNIETREVLLLKLMESEEHLTMRMILMNTAISSLNICKYPSLWLVIREMISKLTPDDKAIVLDIVNKRVPDPFLEEFYTIILEKCRTLKDVDNVSIISNVIQSVSHVMTIMSDKFIESLITEFFVSEMFFAKMDSHKSITGLFLGYLQGAPASSQSENQCLQVAEPRRNLTSRQQFLKQRLNACAINGPRDVLNTVQGIYPVRRLLMMFIERFCRSCLVHSQSTITHEYQLTEYLDFLLSDFAELNETSAVSLPSIYLSMTKVIHMSASQSSFVLGQNIGEFCDSTFSKGSSALLCYFPTTVAKFVQAFVVQTAKFTLDQLLDIWRGMLATVPPAWGTDTSPNYFCHLLRVMTVAHILPSFWLSIDEYKDFRQTFLVLVKGTPAEEILLNVW